MLKNANGLSAHGGVTFADAQPGSTSIATAIWKPYHHWNQLTPTNHPVLQERCRLSEESAMPDLKTALSVGELVANDYRILGMAGAGGMGVVYRAHDIKLERTVALKFLPVELNGIERDKQRFLREARTASSLDHPNIGVIHGIEETADGRAFIVMAFYEGQSLAQKIRSGPLPPAEAIDIALQIARGLAEAHARHIVHRDIKPSNVMLTPSGGVKIVDFGLASVQTMQTASQTGMTGTIAYMSPEQTLGNTVDHRSDIWALGVVLAEMLTGRNPLERETIPGIVMAILNEAPRGVEGAAPELQQIIYRALSKQPAKRYPDCAELIADLERVRALPAMASTSAPAGSNAVTQVGSRSRPHVDVRKYLEQASQSSWSPEPQRRSAWRPWLIGALCLLLVAGSSLLFPAVRDRVQGVLFSSGEKHIAVLPFDNIGSNPENDVLVQGLMDSLAGKLSNLDVGNKSLWVVPTSEIRRRKIADPAEALKELGATLAVKGSVQRDGRAVHLNVNLIDTRSMRQIGSAEVEDQAGDLATLQNEAVSRLARLMNLSVSAEMLRNTGGAVNPAAYEDYLKALGYMQRYDKPGNLDQAIAALGQSVRTDPRFALGYAQLGEAYRMKYQVDSNANWLTEAEAYSSKAEELDPNIPSVYVTLGRLHDTAGKHDLALQEFQHALALNAKSPVALSGLARAYEHADRLADAEASYQKAIALQPDDWDGYNNLALFYNRHNRNKEANRELRTAIELTPDNAQLYLNLAASDIDSGDVALQEEAQQSLQKSIAISPSYPAYANLGILDIKQGRYADAAAATEKALQMDSNNYMVWSNLALAYEQLHEQAKAAAARKRSEMLAEEEVKRNPQDGTIPSVLATCYAQDGQSEKAVAHIRTALALAPGDPSVLQNVAEAYEVLGDRKQALDYIQQALKKGAPLRDLTTDPELQSLLKDPRFHPPVK